AAQLRDVAPHPRRAREQLDREVGAVDRQHVRGDVVAPGLYLADVGKLQVDESPRRSVLPRIEGVPSRASVVGHIDGSAVAKTSNLGADLPFGADLGLQVGVTKVGGNEPRSEIGREWCDSRELVERPCLAPPRPARTPEPGWGG